MNDRAVEIAGFLSHTGWAEARQTPIAADFSTRRFARLERADGRRAILMDADADQKTAAFIAIADLLRGLEISAPEIYAAEAVQGLVLMEDFGDRNVGRLLDAGADAQVFYRQAIELLVQMHQKFDRSLAAGLDLPVFSRALLATQAELFVEAYIPYAKGHAATPQESESFRAAWKTVLKDIEALPQTLMLRDFMPDNLMQLDGRNGWRAIGVLDFQDAGIGAPVYDLASLCEAVRRNAPVALLEDMIDYYSERAQPKFAKGDLQRAGRILSAQRHTRILGIIARLALRQGRREKLAYLPRIWDYLDALLQDEALKPVREWMDQCKMKTGLPA